MPVGSLALGKRDMSSMTSLPSELKGAMILADQMIQRVITCKQLTVELSRLGFPDA